ncbi:hypothetical protein E3N88_43416 [Mikania micrantha]|uniref:Uncharacterized protein n=1 Tax=Mikania micrantha TaxID=192012 RepID=A0A5N6LEX6_9ASTR|nr:hypothetical protein E3N88_43416 [Mikania micrantha]
MPLAATVAQIRPTTHLAIKNDVNPTVELPDAPAAPREDCRRPLLHSRCSPLLTADRPHAPPRADCRQPLCLRPSAAGRRDCLSGNLRR